jgi:hypothetical protein
MDDIFPGLTDDERQRLQLSQDPKRVRARLRSYERKLQKEKEQYGHYGDGAGNRYHVGPHYLLLGDNDCALDAFRWFEQEFPDDGGEPEHLLCWSLALHRVGNEIGAARRLRQAMLSNLYLVPHLIGSPIAVLDIWHGSNVADRSYLDFIQEAYLELWTEAEREWAASLYNSPGFQSVRARYIEIGKLLDTTRPGHERSRLVEEQSELER